MSFLLGGFHTIGGWEVFVPPNFFIYMERAGPQRRCLRKSKTKNALENLWAKSDNLIYVFFIIIKEYIQKGGKNKWQLL